MRVSVIGLGKLGLPWAALIASRGIDVVGVDKDEGVVVMLPKIEFQTLNYGDKPVLDPWRHLRKLPPANWHPGGLQWSR